MRAPQTVDEVEGQAGPAGRLPRVEDLLAVDLCERHLGCLLAWWERLVREILLLWELVW